jgi:hypothetical protein
MAYAQYYRAVALAGLNRLQEAEGALDALAKSAPAGYLAEAVPLHLSEVLLARQDARSAVSVLDDARKDKGLTSPEDLLIRLGRAAEAAGNRDKAIDAIEWTGAEFFSGTINNALMAYRPGEDGKISAKGLAWKADRALPESPSPLYYRGNLYTVKNGGILSCYEAATGKMHYQKRLEADGSYYASPVAGDGKIYLSSMNGTVVVIDAADELHVAARNDLGENLMASPAIVDGKLYIRTAGHLYAFGK